MRWRRCGELVLRAKVLKIILSKQGEKGEEEEEEEEGKSFVNIRL